ncbi:hypothetical protein CAPTEDRAFT_203301 [Capitella teleta]|uniref:Uncharacterized protein n=1 Tax=Capitella teleta TaxID=283909 RepID=R7TTE2_CAPTE|nr:hypothetical protein CAPTEDRAFT_203301 [Capitella teleta]|eukprot:ELT96929.1 hypothetical protein CAPTEDRAFT_203301 [Capitella teleta]
MMKDPEVSALMQKKIQARKEFLFKEKSNSLPRDNSILRDLLQKSIEEKMSKMEAASSSDTPSEWSSEEEIPPQKATQLKEKAASKNEANSIDSFHLSTAGDEPKTRADSPASGCYVGAQKKEKKGLGKRIRSLFTKKPKKN